MNSARRLARDLARCRRRYQAALVSGRKDLGRKRVHDLRTAGRRLQACLALAQAALGGTAGAKAIRRVTSHLHSLGPLRDTQVQLKRLRAMPSGLAGLTPLLAHLQRRARRLTQWAEKHLKAGRLEKRLRALERRLKAVPRNAATERRTRIPLRRALETSRQQAAAAWRRLPPGSADLHRVRIALQRYCLMSDVLPPPAEGPDPRAPSGSTRKLSVLGKVHDHGVLLARVGKMSRRHLLPNGPTDAWRRRLERRRTELLATCQGTPGRAD